MEAAEVRDAARKRSADGGVGPGRRGLTGTSEDPRHAENAKRPPLQFRSGGRCRLSRSVVRGYPQRLPPAPYLARYGVSSCGTPVWSRDQTNSRIRESRSVAPAGSGLSTGQACALGSRPDSGWVYSWCAGGIAMVGLSQPERSGGWARVLSASRPAGGGLPVYGPVRREQDGRGRQ